MAKSSAVRWEEDENGIFKPIISRIHTIPIEDRESLLHCAQLTCWCSPRLDINDNCVVLHQAMTDAKQGWVLIGETDHCIDTNGGDYDHD